jgi:hypothetical protein
LVLLLVAVAVAVAVLLMYLIKEPILPVGVVVAVLDITEVLAGRVTVLALQEH